MKPCLETKQQQNKLLNKDGEGLMMPLLLYKELVIIDGGWRGVIFFSDMSTDK